MDHQDAPLVTSKPAEVFVISMSDTVLLLVDGEPTERNESLVEEMRSSFVSTGTPADTIEVIWQGAHPVVSS
ncbi:MAG TPA: hypothetical protein VM262_21605 [Acidimicrobiales bacterium]|jgi:hypothetical protein|nr:hypothetical protein [Acidimicrobiales bacterium]